MRFVKRVTILIVLTSALTLAFGASSAFAKPCWQRLIDDWYDGRIDLVYPRKCIQKALENAPEDIRSYSDLQSDMKRFLQDSARNTPRQSSSADPKQGRDAAKKPGQRKQADSQSDDDRQHVAPVGGSDDPQGPIGDLFRATGPSDSTSVPVPLLALGGLALLLLASGAAGLVAKRVHARRSGGPATDPPDLST
jgi:hypothetical protein